MPPPFSWQTEGSCSMIPPPLPSWPAMVEAEGSCLMLEAEGGRGRKMERQWNEEGGRGRKMERQWNRRGVTWTWEENPLCVVGSCQWRGDVGSCLENSNVLPFRGETWALKNSGGETWALLFLKRPGGETWALLFLKTTPISDETEGVLQQLIKIQLTTTSVKFS